MKQTQPILKGEEILQLIPQRPPIVMVDAFYGIEGNSSYSGLTVEINNIFCQKGCLQEAGLIEHIAQSAAARIGYLYRMAEKSVPMGFIGSVDKLKINRLPEIGEKLITEITIIQEVGDITLIAARVTTASDFIVDTPCLSECRMKIFLKKE